MGKPKEQRLDGHPYSLRFPSQISSWQSFQSLSKGLRHGTDMGVSKCEVTLFVVGQTESKGRLEGPNLKTTPTFVAENTFGSQLLVWGWLGEDMGGSINSPRKSGGQLGIFPCPLGSKEHFCPDLICSNDLWPKPRSHCRSLRMA